MDVFLTKHGSILLASWQTRGIFLAGNLSGVNTGEPHLTLLVSAYLSLLRSTGKLPKDATLREWVFVSRHVEVFGTRGVTWVLGFLHTPHNLTCRTFVSRVSSQKTYPHPWVSWVWKWMTKRDDYTMTLCWLSTLSGCVINVIPRSTKFCPEKTLITLLKGLDRVAIERVKPPQEIPTIPLHNNLLDTGQDVKQQCIL